MSEYNDQRFSKISNKIKSMSKSDKFNKCEQNSNDIIISKHSNTNIDLMNSKINKIKLNYDLNYNKGNSKIHSLYDSSLDNLEKKYEDLEENSEDIFKQHELKVNLMSEEVNYLIKQIDIEQESNNEIYLKINNDYKEHEAQYISQLENERIRNQNYLGKLFISIEKIIDTLSIDNNLETDLNRNLQIRENYDNRIQIIKEEIQNTNNSNSKKIQTLVNQINWKINNSNKNISLEKQIIEEKESQIILKIEKSLKNLKNDFNHLKYQREKFEENLLKKLEQTCMNLVLAFSDKDYY